MGTFTELLPDGIGAGTAAVLVGASYFTSFMTASIGLGGGVAMLALMAIFVPVTALIPVHGVVQLGSNVGRAWRQRAHVNLRVAAPFMMGSVVGGIVGIFLVVQLPDWFLQTFLGVFLILITWFQIPGIHRLNRPGLAAASVGMALLSMLVGATGPVVAVLFAQYFDNDRKALLATHAAGMSAQHALKTVVFTVAGFAFHDWLPLILAMIFTGFLGTLTGAMLLDILPQARFAKWFKVGMTLLALDILRRGIQELF